MKFIKKLVSKIEFDSPVVVTFSLISLAVLILGAITDGKTTDAAFACYRTGANDPMMYVRMLTYVFGHVNFAHYIGNMSFILLLGPIVEKRFGAVKTIIMMCSTALITGAANCLFFPSVMLQGASGIAFMLILASAFARGRSGKIPLTLLLVSAIYLGGELFDGIFVTDSVSQLGHLLGGVCGLIFGAIFSRVPENAQ